MQTTISILLLGVVAPELCLAFTYPIFGTKRFQRTPQYQVPSPTQYQYPQYQAPQYYPYGSTEMESPYYQAPRREVGNMFGLPTYHGEYKPTPYYYAHGPSYNYPDDRDTNSNPMDDLHEEMLQEEALDRGEYGPIGQEIWYESPGHSSDSLAKANAAFLHNLMLYQRQFGGPKIQVTKEFEVPSAKSGVADSSTYEYDYDGLEWYDNPTSGANSASYHKDVMSPSSLHNKDDLNELNNDKEVKELKALVNKHRKDHDTLYELSEKNNNLYENDDWDQKAELEDEYDDWINWDKRNSAPKKVLPNRKKPTLESKKTFPKSAQLPVTKQLLTTQKPSTIFLSATQNGQKEIVLPRPAAPVKNPFHEASLDRAIPVTSTTKIADSKKHLASQKPNSSGAIYDTIKQILRMEEHLDKEQPHAQKKRYVSNEGSLIKELNTLKRQVE